MTSDAQEDEEARDHHRQEAESHDDLAENGHGAHEAAERVAERPRIDRVQHVELEHVAAARVHAQLERVEEQVERARRAHAEHEEAREIDKRSDARSAQAIARDRQCGEEQIGEYADRDECEADRDHREAKHSHLGRV